MEVYFDCYCLEIQTDSVNFDYCHLPYFKNLSQLRSSCKGYFNCYPRLLAAIRETVETECNEFRCSYPKPKPNQRSESDLVEVEVIAANVL